MIADHSLRDSNSHHWELLQVVMFSVVVDGQLEWNGNDDDDECCWYSAGPDAVNPPPSWAGCDAAGRRNRPASSSSPKRESLQPCSETELL